MFAACSDDTPTTPVKKGEKDLVGDITATTKLDANIDYTLTGALFVKAGATLEIPAGTTIKAKNGGTGIFILVERGAKIIADGTADKPIVFTSTSTSPKEGDWGGIIINGKAPLSGPAGVVTEDNTEMSTSILYGGSDANDNSGILNYVKIAYTGARIDSKKEHNGLTLNGVGKGTKISNIFFTYAGDDAIEFFGGSVDASNILVVNCSDDMFDFTQGYSGTITNVYGIREAGYLDITSDPSGIEADGNKDGAGATHINQSNFTINGITIINNAKDIVSTDPKIPTKMMKDIFRIRRLATAKITNAYFKFGSGAKTDYLINVESANPATTVEYTVDPANGLDKILNNNPDKALLTGKAGLKGADVSAYSWTGYKF